MATTVEIYTHASVIAQREAVNLLDEQVFPSVPKNADGNTCEAEAASHLRQLIDISRLSGAPGVIRTRDPLLRRQTLDCDSKSQKPERTPSVSVQLRSNPRAR
jgi:hypothetical protein